MILKCNCLLLLSAAGTVTVTSCGARVRQGRLLLWGGGVLGVS